MTGIGPFQSAKFQLAKFTNLEKDTLHIIVGLLVFALVIVALRKKPWQFAPFAGASIAALTGEIIDIYELATLQKMPWNMIPWSESIHDLWITTIIPAALFLLSYALRPPTEATMRSSREIKCP